MTITTDFDQVFEKMSAPEYPATCDQCGVEGTNASMEGHVCDESPASRAGQPTLIDQLLDAAIYAEDIDRRVNARVQIAKQHATLVEQREQLVEALRELVDLVEATRNGEYVPDSFTCQPARILLATIEPETEVKSNTSGEAGR